MAIDVTETTMNISTAPFKIPDDCDFYQIKRGGRNIVRERDEQEFVRRFGSVTTQQSRDYRHLCIRVHEAAGDRGFKLDGDWEVGVTSVTLNSLWRATGQNIHLFCDVICAALAKCPTSDENIYK